MPTRPINQELTLPKGVVTLDAVASIDPYYGVFDSQADAFASVPASQRKVGKLLAIYRDSTKRNIIPYVWATHKFSGWVLQSLTGETGTYVGVIGDVAVSENTVTVTAPIVLFFDFVAYSLDEPVEFSFTPVADGNIKVLVVYGLPDSTLLYLAEGEEGMEAIEPVLPEGALFIRRGIATSTGSTFDPEVDLVGLKQKLEDNWQKVPFNQGQTIILQMNDVRQNFFLTGGDTGSGTTLITGLKLLSASMRDFDFMIYNGGSTPVTLQAEFSIERALPTASLTKRFSQETSPLIIPPKKLARLKYDSTRGIIDVMKAAEAGDGKNITNSSNTTTGSHKQTQRIGDTWSWDTNAQSYAIKNLPNKSADSSFDEFLGRNSQGELAKVGYPAFVKTVDSWNNAQRLEFLRKLNNNATEVGMIIGAIYPAVLPVENYATTFIISGSNLNLDQTSRKIEILHATTEAVLETVTGAEITVNSTTELQFTKNISHLGVGAYKIRMYSGLFVTTSEISFEMLDNLAARDLSTLQWNIVSHANYANTQSIGAGGSLTLNKEAAKLANVPLDSIYLSAKSQPVFFAGEDWYVEIDLTDIFAGNDRGFSQALKDSFGIMYNSTQNILLPLGLVKYRSGTEAPAWYLTEWRYYLNNTYLTSSGVSGNLNVPMTIYKQGNVLKMTMLGKTVSLVISNNEDYCFIGQLASLPDIGISNLITPRQININVLKAYKIN